MNDKLLIDRTLLEQALDALLHRRSGSDQVQRIDAAITDLCAALAQEPEPAQEQVGWNWMLDGRPYGQAYYGNPPDADIAERAAIAGRTVRLLYTTPPQRPPLTDEEIRAHADKHLRYQPQSYEASGVFDLVRAIERKVRGEKE